MCNIGLDIIDRLGFMLVCVESLMYDVGHKSGGLWNFPFVQSNETGPKCSAEDSFDNAYMDGVIEELDSWVAKNMHLASNIVNDEYLTMSTCISYNPLIRLFLFCFCT